VVLILYRNVISVLKNPFYAGTYAYVKRGNRTEIVDGRARKTYGDYHPIGEYKILLKDHHEDYIDWDDFERNQKQLSCNAYRRKDGARRWCTWRWGATVGWRCNSFVLVAPMPHKHNADQGLFILFTAYEDARHP
jgi:hypothetical protein